MTITYTYEVSKVRLCGFSRLLCYWRGSIYKLLYREMIIFGLIYTGLSILYRFALNESQRGIFEKISLYCEAFTNLIPISFVLGFYVAMVVTRWWQQYLSIPWPDRIQTYLANLLLGADERARMMRRTIIRYLNLSSVLVLSSMSPVVKKRFPTMAHLVHAAIYFTQTQHQGNTKDFRWTACVKIFSRTLKKTFFMWTL